MNILTSTVHKDLNIAVVHLRQCLHLYVVAMAIIHAFPGDVGGKILRHILGVVICVLHLKRKRAKSLLHEDTFQVRWHLLNACCHTLQKCPHWVPKSALTGVKRRQMIGQWLSFARGERFHY